jgi:mannosyltransferase
VTKYKLHIVFGLLLISLGLFISPSTLIDFLTAPPKGLLEKLLLGARLFKIGLVVLGLIVIILGRISIWRPNVPKDEGLSETPNESRSALLLVILLSACALRLYGLNQGLWYDEIKTYVDYARIPFGKIITTYDSENNHILYTLLAHASFCIFGESAWSLRLPAALFGVASIWALYLLVRKVGSQREALLSSALLTFSYHHIWFSQNARGYVGLLFWTILTSWLFLRGIQESQRYLWLLYALAAALGVYTHITMLFVVIGHFIIFAIMLFAWRKKIWPDRWAGFFFGFCIAALLTFLLYAFVLPQVFGTIGEESNVTTWKNPFWTILEFAKGMKVGFSGIIIAIGALIVTGTGLLSFARQRSAVIGLIFFPAFLGSVVVIAFGHPLWPRFFFFTIGFGVLIVVRGTTVLGRVITGLLKLSPKRSILIGSALCSGLIIASAISIPSVYAPKQDFKGALTFIEQNKELGDAVVTVGLTSFPYKDFYKTDWQEVKAIGDLSSIRFRAKRTWLLYTLPLHLKTEYPEIMTSINNDFKLVKQFHGTLNGGTIFVCVSELSRP